MAAQIRTLRSRIDATRIVPTPKEKAELLRLGVLLGHDVAEIKHEALNYFMCFSLDHLNYIIKTWVTHYNTLSRTSLLRTPVSTRTICWLV